MSNEAQNVAGVTSTDLPQEKPIKFHTLEDLSASQVDAIRRIPAHDEPSSVAIKAGRPTSMYTDPGSFDVEKQAIFRKLPVAITVSARLAEPNTMMAVTAYGVPLIVTRDRDGLSHVFLNACMHKGATLLDSGCDVRKGSRLTCPYHAWSYRLDGQLAGVARAETFKDLDTENRNLAELSSKEAGGIIFAILDRKSKPDFSHLSDELIGDLDALELGQQYLYGTRRFELDGNWKPIIEPFLEGYHVQRLHASSVGPLFADVPSVVTKLGDHIRQTSGKIEFSASDLGEGVQKNIHKIVTHAYMVFPNTIIVTSPYYMSLMIIMPTEVGKTVVDYHMLTLNPADNPHAEKLYKQSYEMVLNVFGNEDFVASVSCYTGLMTGALDDVGVVFSGMESCIPMQYETLDKYLEEYEQSVIPVRQS